MTTEGLTISDVAERTGVPVATLRVWERRRGFPVPRRLPSGHRRYTVRDVELVSEVAQARAAGVGLTAAIELVRNRAAAPGGSLYASLRRSRPELEPQRLAKPVLLALSHAIEDESLARAERPVLFASFQRERFYRGARERWGALAAGAEVAVVFADFAGAAEPPGAPAEAPFPAGHELAREWTIVCDAPRHGVCLSAREPPGSEPGNPLATRCFEVIWSVEPDVVRYAARFCAGLAQEVFPALGRRAAARLDSPPVLPTVDQLRLAAGITARTIRRVGAPSAG